MDDFGARNNTNMSSNMRMFPFYSSNEVMPSLYNSAIPTAAQHFPGFSSTIFTNHNSPGTYDMPVQQHFVQQYQLPNPSTPDAYKSHRQAYLTPEQHLGQQWTSVSKSGFDIDNKTAYRPRQQIQASSSRMSATMNAAPCVELRPNAATGESAQGQKDTRPAGIAFSGDTTKGVPPKVVETDKICVATSGERVERPKPLTVSSVDHAPLAATTPITCDTRISMTLLGQVITYDLKTLDSNPRVIIELLKATQSERMNYMIVGAFYRRSSLPHSARAVICAMLEEFTAQGVPSADLKPAYLFLSGCETDLAKLNKSLYKDASVVAEHYASATKWLQKVYGKAEPSRTSSGDKEKPLKFTALSKKVSHVSLMNNGAAAVERVLESLRDKNRHLTGQVVLLRDGKRKAEDDYEKERGIRRRLEQQVETLTRERDGARKVEQYALDQVRREVEKRKELEKVTGIVERRANM